MIPVRNWLSGTVEFIANRLMGHRYLQESGKITRRGDRHSVRQDNLYELIACAGHGEAAVKLERDWNVDPQSLPFAQYIKTHALVLLVQKGLQYHEIEQSLNQVRYRVPLVVISISDVVAWR